jgi:predicted flap endonuclease-1-like 5' DNA nuclease
VIGPGVAAVPAEAHKSFKVIDAKALTDKDPETVELTIKPGRIWADGLLAYLPKNDSDSVKRLATYLEGQFEPDTRDAVILELWREAINGFQMPEMLIEPALGGPDTIERIHTAMAFKLLPLNPGDNCSNIAARLKDDFSKKGKLTVSLQPTQISNTECPVLKSGGYSGPEHYLFRIEIARTSEPPVMFKWSRFNGGLVGRGKYNADDKKIAITANYEAITKSGLRSFYLEVVSYSQALGHWQVAYGAQATLNSENQLELPDSADILFGTAPEDNEIVFFRLWDGIKPISEFPISNPPDEPNELVEGFGIRLEFEPSLGDNYKAGDYWTFEVRADNENKEILIDSKPPQGIVYHRVPLAIIQWDSENIAQRIDDCRRIFHPLTAPRGCCTILVGDGRKTHGDFDSIEEALRHLPNSGGDICLLPGLHRASVMISAKRKIRIRGCGPQTIVLPDYKSNFIFKIIDSKQIKIEDMILDNRKGIAIQIIEETTGECSDIETKNNQITALINAVRVEGGSDILIENNYMSMFRNMIKGLGGGKAIYILANSSTIKSNRIILKPVRGIPSHAQGGIQVEAGCEDVNILKNTISGGLGNGITLGTSWEVGGTRENDNESKTTEVSGTIMIDIREWPIFVYLDELKNGMAKTIQEREYKTDAQGNCKFSFTNGKPGRYKLHVLYKDKDEFTWFELENEDIQVEQGFLAENIRKIDKQPYGYYFDIYTQHYTGFIYDLLIEGNHISDMGMSGIGFDSTIEKFTPVENLKILRNHIVNCLNNTDYFKRDRANWVGFGGISLGICEGVSIHGNHIEKNGNTHNYPTCGVFVLIGETVDITRNLIVNNGSLNGELSQRISAGNRGGIFIFAATPSYFSDARIAYGKPAARIHDNIVDQPAGGALVIESSRGPLSIINNRFNSELSGPNEKASIRICNFGGIQLNGESNPLTSGSVLFCNNQNRIGPNSRYPCSQFIFSADEIDFHNNQSEVSEINNVLFEYKNTGVFINTLLADYRIPLLVKAQKEENEKTRKMRILNFLRTQENPKSIAASGNRFIEFITGSRKMFLISLFSLSYQLNTTVYNQGDNCIWAMTNPVGQLVKNGNLVSKRSTAVKCSGYLRTFEKELEDVQIDGIKGGIAKIAKLRELLITKRFLEIQKDLQLLLKKEKNRLIEKYGDDDPRSQRVAVKLAHNKEWTRMLEEEMREVEIKETEKKPIESEKGKVLPPINLEDIKGIGKVSGKKLRDAGIGDVKAFAEADDEKLKGILGNMDIAKLKKESLSLLKKSKE